MTQQTRGISIVLGLIAIVLISGILWTRIFSRNVSEKNQQTSEQPTSNEAPAVPVSTGTDTSPVLRGEAPKLAGNIVVGPKVATKFYLSKNGKRYVFPDETKTFDTWFPSGTKIVNLSEAELESYPLGGNVCYRPGTRLIRITSDTRVFAVAHNCTLRPINDGTAEKMFGKNWRGLIDTLQDFYFTNYTIGEQISSTADYSVEIERGKSPNVDADKNIQ